MYSLLPCPISWHEVLPTSLSICICLLERCIVDSSIEISICKLLVEYSMMPNFIFSEHPGRNFFAFFGSWTRVHHGEGTPNEQQACQAKSLVPAPEFSGVTLSMVGRGHIIIFRTRHPKLKPGAMPLECVLSVIGQTTHPNQQIISNVCCSISRCMPDCPQRIMSVCPKNSGINLQCCWTDWLTLPA